MHASTPKAGFSSALLSSLVVLSLALATPASSAGGGGGGGGGGGSGGGASGGGASGGGASGGGASGGGASGGGASGGGASGGGASGGGAGGGAGGGTHKSEMDLTTCSPGQVWDARHHKCLVKRSDVLPDPELTEYAFSLAKAERYQEALDTLDMLQNPNTPRALNYRGYATRKLGRTDEGIGYYLKSVELDPEYPQVREYLGEAYVIQGKYDLAKEQLTTIEKLCGSKECEYYEDLHEALEDAHAL